MNPSQADYRLLHIYGGDILSSPGMQAEKAFFQHGSTSCYTHSVLVTLTALWLAAKLPIVINRRSLVRGALLHDYFLYDWHDPDPGHRLHGFTHARRALQNAKRDFDLSLREEDIIRTHMFPLNLRPFRYRESAIVSLADKICAMREVFRLPMPPTV